MLVDIRKYDGSLSARWHATRLGDDDYGAWLGTAQGTRISSGSGGWTSRFAYTMLVPRGEWWTATFCADPGPEMYCDVCTVPEWQADGTRLRAVDLDLDVVRPRGGDVWVKDEDEFAEHRVSYGYPDGVVDKVWQTCGWLMEAGRRDGAEPFASAYHYWLDQMR